MQQANDLAEQNGCWFDESAAERVCKFFPTSLRHSKGEWAGKPFRLLPWQEQDIIRPLFGWKRADGRRRFDRAYIEVPKKQGKSTLASGVGLYMLVGDKEPGAEVYSVAVDREQASIVHGEAIRMVESSPTLVQEIKLNRSTKEMSHQPTNSIYRALSKDIGSKHGLNIHCAIMDELHAWYGREMWETLKYGAIARRQPLFFVITTAGDDMQSVCREQHDYAVGVLNGHIHDDGFFAYIRAAEPDDDWTSPETWKKANPSFGYTIREDEMIRSCAEASQTPATEAAFKRYRLNVWCTAETPWLRINDWKACEETFTEDDLEGRECYAALDLAKTKDMTALVLAFEDGDLVRLLPYFWMPAETARERRALVPYDVWARGGYLNVTPGNTCRYDLVVAEIERLSQKFAIRELAYDPWNAEATTQEIDERLGIERVEFRQTIANYAEATGEFERRLLDRTIRHNGHPILAWQASHVQVYSDANGNRRPVKPKQGDIRTIDGIVAALMATARLMREEHAEVGIQLV